MQQNPNHFSRDAERLLRANGVDPAKIQNEEAKKLLNSLDRRQAEQISQLLNNKEELNRLLNSDAAKQIMQKLFGAGGAK